ncbi:hypothetical protein ACFWOL_19695 [Streptomyces sp. NPDC058442]|uniref:hypothetical protein n=1 Tax=Streptomyces sp. NPDC058442 TaxID=3346503 RepID=UPI00365333B0
MNDELETFIRTYLHADTAYDTSNFLRPTLLAFNESFVRRVKEGFDIVLREGSLTKGEYERLTEVEFTEDETLHYYLQSMYDHLFENQPVQPSLSQESRGQQSR